MRVIDRIANLILEDPLITANRLAQKLGYAEEKTIYYWLHKAHYKGLTAFKKAVLHGQFLPQASDLGESPGLYGRLPVTEGWTDDGQPIFLGESLPVPQGAPAELIWRYSGPPVQFILPGDLLVLAHVEPSSPNPWAVARTDQGVVLRVAIHLGPHKVYLHPWSLERDRSCHPLYQILQLIRQY